MNQTAIRPIAQRERPTRSPAAAAAAAGFIGLAGFELALTLGAPLGRAAMGGTHIYLRAGLRIVSGIATLLWPLAALVVLGRGGYRVPLISARVSRAGTWGLVGLLSLGAHEPRLLQRLGALPAGTHRRGPGGAVPGRRAGAVRRGGRRNRPGDGFTLSAGTRAIRPAPRSSKRPQGRDRLLGPFACLIT
jgi:hypothetical protein